MNHAVRYGLILLFVVSIGFNVLVGTTFFSSNAHDSPVNQSDYPYLSRRIFTEDPADLILNFIGLRTELKQYIQPLNSKVGLYFEYLPSGVSIGINEKQEFRLASLAKVPTIMAIYKQIALGNLKRTDTFTINQNHIDKTFGTSWKKGAGATISVDEAIKFTLIESDNTTHNLLLAHLLPGALNDVYDSFDIAYSSIGNFPAISAKNYSSILRSLYLAAYLPKAFSNEILSTLTQTIFKDKIPAGVPETIPIAHKIGVVEKIDPKDSFFTDCGIIYVPKRPYILCIIVNGSNQNAQTYMKEISSIVYRYISKVKTPY